MDLIRNYIRNTYYFLKGYDADRFSAPKFYIRELKDLLKIRSFGYPIRLIISRKKCRWNAGFKLKPEVHPFIATMESGDITYLYKFYENFKPENVWEMYFLSSRKPSSLVSFPWKRTKSKSELIEMDGLSEDQGHQWFGPVSSEKIHVEYQRCMNCYQSIKNEGYFPQKYGGYPRGYFLVGDHDYCFQIGGGQHRIAALAALKWNRIEVMSMNGPFQYIYRSEVDNWPAVREGHISRNDALTIFYLHLKAGTYKKQKEIFNF